MFTKEFFDLQFSWAERVGAVSGTALEQALFEFTNFYGQFLDHRGHVRRAVKQRFLDSLSVQLSQERLDDCFPLQVLTVHAPVQTFYEFYGV